MDRVLQRNVLAMSGRAVEAAGDVDVLLLDKTGTITLGNRMAVGVSSRARSPTERPGGLGATELACRRNAGRPQHRRSGQGKIRIARARNARAGGDIRPFTAQTRMSGVDLHANGAEPTMRVRKGAAEAVRGFVESAGGIFPQPVAKDGR